MTGEITVDWDVEFWASRYPLHYLSIYNRELSRSPSKRLHNLWRWKSLHRSAYGPEDAEPFLDDARELCQAIDGGVANAPIDEITDAFLELRSRLKEPDGPLSERSRVAVTPQFLLHLVDSDGVYSGRFPILDAMVARAIRTRTATDESRTLQDSLTCSEQFYRQLVEYVLGNCQTPEQVARMERALFVQGRSIGRYRANEGVYDEIRNVPVSTAREYLSEIRRNASG